MATVLSSPFFVEYVLPFILIFTVVFAILQKSKLLGEGKKQIDSLVALVVALIVISFANAVGIINSLLPFLAVSIVIILVFLLLVAMVYHDKEKGLVMPKGVQITIAVLAAIAVIAAVLVVTGAWDYILTRWFSPEVGSNAVGNIVFIIIIIVALVFALWPEKKDK